MPEHEELQADIPAYVTSKLEASALERLERHLRECEMCRELAACWKIVGAGLRDGGEDLFTPHPEPLTLKDHAFGRPGQSRGEVERHLASCSSCRLELEAWKAHLGEAPETGRTAQPPSGPASRRGLLRPAFLLAAGVVLGVGLSLVLLRTPQAPGTPPQGSASTSGQGGLVSLWVLPGPLRGAAQEASFRMPAGEAQVLIVVRPTLPADASPDDVYLWELVAENGERVWSHESSGSRIRSSLETSEVATLAVPTAPLAEGAYELTLARVTPAPRQGTMQIPFRVLAPQP